MVKLVILIEPLDDWSKLEAAWPQFLHDAEEMPGLQREAASTIDSMLYGNSAYMQMHELFFDSLEAAWQAMSSPPGQAAGRLLQEMTDGKLVLFFADYKEDDIANLRKYKAGLEGNA
jgi:uncharacterized protein (TIGR02118 family)